MAARSLVIRIAPVASFALDCGIAAGSSMSFVQLTVARIFGFLDPSLQLQSDDPRRQLSVSCPDPSVCVAWHPLT